MAAGCTLVRSGILAERGAGVLLRIALCLVISCVTLRTFQADLMREIAGNLALSFIAATLGSDKG